MTEKTTEQAAPEIMADIPKSPSREQNIKRLMDKYPGHISWASDRANFSGCRIVTFGASQVSGLTTEDGTEFIKELESSDFGDGITAEDAMNLYFSKRGNLLVVDMKVHEAGITCLVTTQLDDDDLEELQETQNRISLEMREWHEKRAERKMEEVNKVKEERRLADVGRKAEEFGFFKKLRELEDEVKALKKEG